ncbi:MAG: hypothetical protein HC838_16765 [Spirulinaceae cyanobacterium RM2_2_10]|nr:hypothetical protein [Spirulinaceae cyanobacterium SM2_1_0]NJO21351.1 hypothetical protein [Spirulinaceae cyanobacterium RM2_2_10]
MKLSRVTWIWIVLALILSSVVYIGEVLGRQRREAAQAIQQQLFDFPADAIETIAIEYRDRDPLAFEQVESESASESESETLAWQMTEPLRSPASDPAMSFLVNLLVEGEQQQAFRIDPDDLATYELAEPFATLTITTREQPAPYRVALGRTNFEGQLIYAQVDSPATDETGELEVVLVPIDLQYAVERELNEWLAAPDVAPEVDDAEATSGNDDDNDE